MREKSPKLTLNIGKNGITDGLVEEIKLQLKKKKIVKLKMLRSAFEKGDKKAIVDEVVRRTGSKLVSFIGFTFILERVGEIKRSSE